VGSFGEKFLDLLCVGREGVTIGKRETSGWERGLLENTCMIIIGEAGRVDEVEDDE